VRTALFNYLFAKKHKGTFILRIEDTDQARYVPGAEDYIVKALEWCGISPGEGVSKDGPFAPYRQSERQSIYREYAEKLIASGNAYYAFDTPEETDALRKEYEARKETFTYDYRIRAGLRNSLSLGDAESKRLLESGTPYVVRFRFPENQEIAMNDIIRGHVMVNTSTLDDKVLFKSDGMPTYHLANVVDDYLMQISHVIRGEEWLPSLPLHVSLYKAFGWEASMPEFAHLPLILKPDGKGKLSKRDGDKGGFPVFPLEWKDPATGEISGGYRETGYFPEACINILALLGWNPGTEQEIFSLDELVQAFDLTRVGKSGSKFDPEKARWYNHQYLQNKPVTEIAAAFSEVLKSKGVSANVDEIVPVVSLVRERASFVKELWDHADFFFQPPATYDAEMVKKRWKEDSRSALTLLAPFLETLTGFTAAELETRVKTFMEQHAINPGTLMTAWRLALVGAAKGPGMFDIAAMLGKKECLQRIQKALQSLP
jgi:glutamyl-tRNA synthetase